MISVVLPDLLPILEVYMARLRPNTVIEYWSHLGLAVRALFSQGISFFTDEILIFRGCLLG